MNAGNLVGAALHGFQTMMQLLVSLTLAFDQRRWLTNEETTAVLLNPHPFRHNNGVMLNDQGFTVDCYFLVISEEEFQDMAHRSGPAAELNHQWPFYCEGILIYGPLKEDKFVGFKKNNPKHRRMDTTEIVCERFEVKGSFRCRRRTVLPNDFEDTAHFANPFPNLMLVQYQLCPDSQTGSRVEEAAAMETEIVELRQQLGEAMIPLYGGPARPPGILPLHLGLNLGPGQGMGQGRGQGRGRGRGRGRGQGEGEVQGEDQGQGRGRGRGRGRGHGRRGRGGNPP